MARYGTWRPLASDWAAQPRMKQHDIICLHTAVGSLWGTDGYFRQAGYGGTESHFGVGHDGEVLQWQDTTRQADANYQGGWHVLSIETADVGPGFGVWNLNDGRAVPAWTEAQVEAIARLVAFLCREHNIPCELIPDSKVGRRGVAYHRQGVPGYVVSGGELWSTSPGKVCPGDRRIAQIPRVIARAQQLLRTDEDIDMATGDEILTHLHGYGRRIEDTQTKVNEVHTRQVGYGRRIERTEAEVVALRAQVVELLARLDAGATV